MTFFERREAILSPVVWRTSSRHYGEWQTVTSNITDDLVSGGWDETLFASAYSEVDAKVAECLHISGAFDHAADFNLIHNHYNFIASETPVSTTKTGPYAPLVKHGEKIGPWYPLHQTPWGGLSVYDGVFRTTDASLYRLGLVWNDLQNAAGMRGVSEKEIVHRGKPWATTGYVHNTVFHSGASAVICTGEANITDLVGLNLFNSRPAM